MKKLMLSFLFGLGMGVGVATLVIEYKHTPHHRDDVESAYVMGCYVGVDMFISADREARTCSELKYYRRR